MYTILQINSTKLVILCYYRALSSNLNHFFDLLDETMKQVEQASVELTLW